ncbi:MULTISPECIES: hypothetical protein [Streptomyces]|uniref:hypothetical protein n=1 Tax=Streptomyces lycopersici TaxID=2974589 RepID=UPI0021CF8943|nr:hypothetical protein [Streptomyces sp. NEAU-383]
MQDIRYTTAGGAVVTVSAVPEESSVRPRIVRAACGGCATAETSQSPLSYEDAAGWAKKWANQHAAGCRALPQT